MKSKVLVTLFALPFLAVGAWMAASVGGALYQSWQMQDWVPVEATLSRGGYETLSGENSDSYRAYADYTYTYAGRQYSGNRVSLSKGGDNIGSYQQDKGLYLQRAMSGGTPVIVYVDPGLPGESIIDRDLRWGLLGFKSVFILVFGGVGLGLVIFVWRRAAPKDPTRPEYQASPWLLNDAWQSPTIRSNSKTAMWGAWFFAAFWNAISAILPFIVYREVVDKGNYPALFGLLFPLIGVGLLVWAIRRTLEWRRFGAAPVTLDPFPGSIGGHVGGTIELHLPFDAAAQFQLTLSCLRSYISGSGKNRSRKEEAKWQSTMPAHAEPGAAGTRLVFRFDVPEGLDPSDADPGSTYYLWRLNLQADLPGTDLDRDYEIPVYATNTLSRHLSDRAIQDARTAQQQIDDKAVGDIIDIRQDAGPTRMIYPAGRHVAAGMGGILVGGAFAAIGWYLVVNADKVIFGSLFGGIGALIVFASLYTMFNSLEVSMQNGWITSVRRFLGIPISRKRMRQSDFERFVKKSTMQTQSGGKHVMYYAVYATDRQDNKLILGEGFQGENEADAALDIMAARFNLDPVAADFD